MLSRPKQTFLNFPLHSKSFIARGLVSFSVPLLLCIHTVAFHASEFHYEMVPAFKFQPSSQILNLKEMSFRPKHTV